MRAVGAAAVTVDFEHVRPPEPAWQAALDAIAPPADCLTSLYLAWEPGDVWQPVQRWIIWQVRPVALVRPDVLAELRGPHPRSAGFYHPRRRRWVGGPAGLVDRRQWELFHATGGFCTRWWTVQGDRGGHRYRLDATEARVAQMHGHAGDTPAAGDLPYAAPDGRTWALIAERDAMRRHALLTDFAARSPEQLDAEDQQAIQYAQDELWRWLSQQLGATLDAHGAALRDSLRGVSLPAGFRDTTDYDAEFARLHEPDAI